MNAECRTNARNVDAFVLRSAFIALRLPSMATLIYNHAGSRRGGVIDGRVLFGRKLPHGVAIDDPAVSRLHAWIDRRNDTFLLTDAGSRTGTFVNGEGVVRRELVEGDTIRVGPIDVVFSETDGLPDDVEALPLSQRAPVEIFDGGIIFNCKCGAPLWVSGRYAGRRGVCKFCDAPLRVPKHRTTEKKKTAAKQSARAKCGVCHSPINEGEETKSCPDCGTTFHADCWQENYGCSSYGCPQVNKLKPPDAETESTSKAADMMVTIEEPARSAPWDLLLLAGSIVGSVIGGLLFGVPAVLVALVASARLFTGRAQRRGLVALAVVVSVVGVVGGLALSDFWWFSGEHLSLFRR
jgi:pSer/pThr/pTyr-binding forkhead associated (FHA) protein